VSADTIGRSNRYRKIGQSDLSPTSAVHLIQKMQAMVNKPNIRLRPPRAKISGHGANHPIKGENFTNQIGCRTEPVQSQVTAKQPNDKSWPSNPVPNAGQPANPRPQKTSQILGHGKANHTNAMSRPTCKSQFTAFSSILGQCRSRQCSVQGIQPNAIWGPGHPARCNAGSRPS